MTASCGDLSTAHFAQLLEATLNADPLVRQDVERRLQEAETTNLTEFALACARSLASQGNSLVSRQVAGVLLKNIFTTNRTGLADMERRKRWREGMSNEAKVIVRESVLLALQDARREVWLPAAAVVGKIGGLDLHDQAWPELLPQLQRMVEPSAGGTSQVPALRTLGYIAENLWVRSGQDEVVPAVAMMLRMIVSSMSPGHPLDVRISATESLFPILGHAKMIIEKPSELEAVLQAVLQNCALSEPAELNVSAYVSLSRMVAEMYEVVGASMSTIAPVSWETIKHGPEKSAVVAVDMWNSLASLEQSVEACNQQYMRQAAPIFVPVLLTALARVSSDGEANDLLEACSNCLAVVTQVAGEVCVDTIFSFLSAHFESAQPNLRVAALLAYGSIMEGPVDKVAPVVAQSFNAVLQALDNPLFRRAAAWAVGRALEFHPACVPDTVKIPLIEPCLNLAKEPEWSYEIGYVLRVLMASVELNSEQFQSLCKRLLTEASHTSSESRDALFGALVELIKNADAKCVAHFRDLLLQLLSIAQGCQGQQIDGIGACLQALTEKLGSDVLGVAEDMMKLYMSVLQAGFVSGNGLHEETLCAVSALLVALGPKSNAYVTAFWPILKHAIVSPDSPQVGATGLRTLKELIGALGEAIAPYAEETTVILLQLLNDPSPLPEFKPKAVQCLGQLACALGASTPRLNEWLDSVNKIMAGFFAKGKGKGKGKDKGSDKGKGGKPKGGKQGKERERLVAAGMVNRVPDFVIHMLELQDAIIEAQAAVLVVLYRTASLGMITLEQMSGIGWMAAKKACGAWADEPILLSAAKILAIIGEAYPQLVAELTWICEQGGHQKLVGVLAKSSDLQFRELVSSLHKFGEATPGLPN